MDDLDRAQDAEQRDRDLALRAQMRRAAEQAHWIEADGARICIDCGEPIAAERILARPQAARCIDCERIKEQQQRLYR